LFRPDDDDHASCGVCEFGDRVQRPADGLVIVGVHPAEKGHQRVDDDQGDAVLADRLLDVVEVAG